jgi:hypothetical protein
MARLDSHEEVMLSGHGWRITAGRNMSNSEWDSGEASINMLDELQGPGLG